MQVFTEPRLAGEPCVLSRLVPPPLLMTMMVLVLVLVGAMVIVIVLDRVVHVSDAAAAFRQGSLLPRRDMFTTNESRGLVGMGFG